MSKSTVTTAKLPIVDLVRNKPKLNHIEIPVYRADVVIEITRTNKIKKPSEVPSTSMNRYKDVAEEVMLEYEKVIKEEAVRLDKKIDGLMQQPSKTNLKLAEEMIRETNLSIRNALAGAEPAAQKAVAAEVKKDKHLKGLLKETRIKTTVKTTLGVIKISGAVAKLVATAGADVTSYKTLIVEVAKLGVEINQQLKNEAKLRRDLQQGLATFLKLRESSVQQALERQGLHDVMAKDFSNPMNAIKETLSGAQKAGEEITKGRDIQSIGRSILDFAVKKVKSLISDVEKARVAYRNHTAKTLEKSEKLGSAADKLMKKMKEQKTLKEGVKIGAKCMELKRQGTAMNKKLAERQAFLDEIQQMMMGNGLEIDDRTTIQKIKDLEKLTIMEEGKGIFDAIRDVKDLVDNVASAVA